MLGDPSWVAYRAQTRNHCASLSLLGVDDVDPQTRGILGACRCRIALILFMSDIVS